MVKKFWRCSCGLLLAAAVLLTGWVPLPAARAEQSGGMTLDVPELTLEMTEDDPQPIAYLDAQDPEGYFFLIWTSSNLAVASVDGTGKVTGRSEGTAVITARNERGEKASCTITVQKGTVNRPVLSETAFTLTITAEQPHPARQLNLLQNPGNFIYVRQWASSDPAVVTVNGGTVTAVGSGRAVVTALTTAGQVLRCAVTVTSEVGRVTVSKNAMLLQSVGVSQRLTAKVAKQEKPVLYWVSSNPEVAQVSEDGVVTGVGDGETMIQAITQEGRSDACYVAVGAAAWRYRSEEELTEALTLAGQLPYSDGK